MTKLILVITCQLIFSIGIFSQTGWNLNYYDSIGVYFWNTFSSSNTGYTVGAIFVAGTSYPRIIKTTNAGNSWFEQPTPIAADANVVFGCVHFMDANTGIVTAAHNTTMNYGKILRTTNGGTNWIDIPLPINKYLTNIYFVNSLTGYVSSTANYILKTTDGGLTWNDQNSNFNAVLAGIYFTNVNTGYVVGNYGNIRKTTDGGANWFALSSPTSTSLWGIWFRDVNTGFAVGGYHNINWNVILKTTNAGVNWDSIPCPNSTAWLYSIRFINSSVGYIIGWNSIVLKTTNGGLNWYCQSLPVSSFAGRTCYFTDINTGYIAGHSMVAPYGIPGRIFKTTTGGDPVGINPISIETPDGFELHQNYPNPFNPNTIIKFDLPKPGDVKLTVFDVLGREVAMLINEKLNAGTYEVEWDGSNFPSGVYFYKLISGDFSETKKMVLVK